MAARVGIVTCVQLGLACIEEVLDAGGKFALFLTLKDDLARDKSGRVYLDRVAADTATPLIKIRHINEPRAVAAIAEAGLDWLLIIGWSQIAGPEVLAAAKRGALGIHPSLLPEGRGRAAIPWAILKNLPRTGVTLFRLDAGVDRGPIVDREVLPLAEDETATRLYRRVVAAHRTLIRRAWPNLIDGRLEMQAQDESRASYWPARTPAEGLLYPAEMTRAEVDRHIRALTRPYPGARVVIGDRTYALWAGGTARDSGGLVLACVDGDYVVSDYQLIADAASPA